MPGVPPLPQRHPAHEAIGFDVALLRYLEKPAWPDLVAEPPLSGTRSVQIS